MKHLTTATLALAASLALVAGCESPSKATQGAQNTAPVQSRTTAGTTGAGSSGAAPSGVAQSGVSTVDLTARNNAAANAAAAALLAAPRERVVYFDFDSFVIKDDYKGMLDGHAKVMARTSGKRMVIEGHTDERGGREYNLALGQKRAEAVVKSLELLGVNVQQLEAVSFGEERPAAQGGGESAWAQNRRAEMKDR